MLPVLREYFKDCDAVVHLAWSAHSQSARAHSVNLAGSRRVFEAAGQAGIRYLIHASSYAVYQPDDIGTWADENRPRAAGTDTQGVRKIAAEDALDETGKRYPQMSVARIRPALVLQQPAASQLWRRGLGPAALARTGVARTLLPLPPGFAMQVVHAEDVADAIRLMLDSKPEGTYNLAAQPQ